MERGGWRGKQFTAFMWFDKMERSHFMSDVKQLLRKINREQ